MRQTVLGVVYFTGLLSALHVTLPGNFEPHGSGEREPVDAVLAVPDETLRPVTFAPVRADECSAGQMLQPASSAVHVSDVWEACIMGCKDIVVLGRD